MNEMTLKIMDFMLYVYVGDIIILKFMTNRKTACDTKMLRLHSTTNNMTTICVKNMLHAYTGCDVCEWGFVVGVRRTKG